MINRVPYVRVGVAMLAVLGLALPASSAYAAGAPRVRQHPHALPGDFDGDGKVDLAIGAPGHNRVQIRYTRAKPRVAWVKPNAHSVTSMGFGSALAVGDFNGDGYSDLAVGAPDYQPAHQHGGEGNPETQGAVFVFYGGPHGLHHSPLTIVGPYDGDEPYHLGTALAAADVDGDGYADLATTLPDEDNGIQVYFGSKAGLTTHREENRDDPFAGSIAFGDVNGDGYRDLIANDSFNEFHEGQPGSVHVWYGSKHGLATKAQTILGRKLGVVDGMGAATATGDINGDGLADVVLGNADDLHGGTRIGSIVVLYGGKQGLSAAHSVRITEARLGGSVHDGDGFGQAVDIGKVTGDHFADVAVGAPGSPVTGHHNAGAVFLLRGSAHGITVSHAQRFTQTTPHLAGAAHTGSDFGAAVFLAQVHDGANLDLLAGAPGEGGGVVVRLTGTNSGLTPGHAGVLTDSTAHDGFGSVIR